MFVVSFVDRNYSCLQFHSDSSAKTFNKVDVTAGRKHTCVSLSINKHSQRLVMISNKAACVAFMDPEGNWKNFAVVKNLERY